MIWKMENVKCEMRNGAASRPGDGFTSLSLHPSAFSLIEVVIAVGLFSFVVVAIMSTMTVALTSTRDSEMKLRAAHAGAAIIGTVKGNPASGTNTNFPLPDLTAASGKLATAGTDEMAGLFVDRFGRVAPPSEAAFLLSWRLTRDGELTNLVYCYLDLTWPPAASATNAIGSHRVAATVLLQP